MEIIYSEYCYCYLCLTLIVVDGGYVICFPVFMAEIAIFKFSLQWTDMPKTPMALNHLLPSS